MISFNKKVMLLQSGLYIMVGLITIMVMNLVVSGDSITPRNNSITPPLTVNESAK